MSLPTAPTVRHNLRSAVWAHVVQLWRNASLALRPERVEQLSATLALVRIPPSIGAEPDDPPWTPFSHGDDVSPSQSAELSHSAIGPNRRRWSRP